MDVNRRDFIKSSFGILILPNLEIGLELLTDEIPYDHNFSVDELELVGKKRPELYGDNYNLREIPSKAFSAMRADAEKDGIKIYSLTSYRNFESRVKKWNNKFQEYAKAGISPQEAINLIMTYLAPPGTSRHHWGTDVDIIPAEPLPPEIDNPLQPKHFAEGGVFEDLATWLEENAHKYGFYQVYTNDPKRTGFKPEPWHYSYAELSIPLLMQIRDMPIGKIEKHLKDKTVKGIELFSREFLTEYKNKYMLGTNPLLRPNTLDKPYIASPVDS